MVLDCKQKTIWKYHSLSISLHFLLFLGLTWSLKSPTKLLNIPIEVVFSPSAHNSHPVSKNLMTKRPTPPIKNLTKQKGLVKNQVAPRSSSEEKTSALPLNPGPKRPTDKKANDIKSLYISSLMAQIEGHKIYPAMAKRLQQSGKVVVMLEILKNGSIQKRELIEKSKYPRLNSAALQLIAKLKEVPPLPDELHLDSWQVVIPIAYVLR